MKIAIVAPCWERESTADQIYLAALSRLLAERHPVRILTGPELVDLPRGRTAPAPGIAGQSSHVVSRCGLPAVGPAGSATTTASLTVDRLPASAGDRLPTWLAGSALARPLVRWSLAPVLDEMITWADAVLIPESGEALVSTLIYLAATALPLLPPWQLSERGAAGGNAL